MIRWSTPTQPVHVLNVDLTHMAKVVVTFAQGCRRLDVEDPPMEYDVDTDTTTLYPTLTQLQTAGFAHGTVEVQVNAIDAAGYRVPSDIATFHMGSNLLDEPMDGSDPTPGGIVPTGTVELTENGTFDVARYAYAEVDVPGSVPTGTIAITENGEVDVSGYATASVAVPTSASGNIRIVPNVTEKDISQYATVTCEAAVLLTYDLNGATGEPPSPEAVFRSSVKVNGVERFTYPNLIYPARQVDGKIYWTQYGTATTIPTGKAFAGWSTSPTAGVGVFKLDRFLGEDTTVYAVWVDA